MGGRLIPAVFFCLQVHGPTTGRGYKRKFTVFFFLKLERNPGCI